MQASYQASVAGFRGELPVPDGPLKSGRHSLTREVVLASQRGRLLDAMAHAVAEHGYGATTVAHVVAIAGVSRKTFYEHFRDKEDCFLALYDTGIAYVLGRLGDALRDEAPETRPEARIAAGLRTFLTVLAEEPAFSSAIVLEVRGAGARALARRRAALETFAQRFELINGQAAANDPSIPPLSHDVALALVGAILELVAIRIDDGQTEQLPDLCPLLTDFVGRHVAPTSRAPAHSGVGKT
jgi:AcrR family transcriptional regulator